MSGGAVETMDLDFDLDRWLTRWMDPKTTKKAKNSKVLVGRAMRRVGRPPIAVALVVCLIELVADRETPTRLLPNV